MAPTLRDNVTTGDNDQINIYGDNWEATSFQAASDYTITSVKIKIKSVGTGLLTIKLCGVDGANKPNTAVVYSTGTLNNPTPNAWNEITMSAYDVVSGTIYAIVAYGPASLTPGEWRWGNSSIEGGAGWSTDSGATWDNFYQTKSAMFEVWGTDIVPPTPPAEEPAPAVNFGSNWVDYKEKPIPKEEPKKRDPVIEALSNHLEKINTKSIL